jgi:Ni/Fe-hydrogenase subunit HybB-like protein
MLEKSFRGSRAYWVWLLCLVVLIGAGFVAYLRQWGYGLTVTGLSRDVSWGLYIANFTFFVGVAASAVMVVLPYYLHNVKAFAKAVILGEFLAIGAVIMSVLFIFVDLGRPDRVFNVLLHPAPSSLLFWDMIVLNGYLLLNLLIGWSSLDAEDKGEIPVRWVKPLIIISIPWAVSIHTVTAFIYTGLVARPLWHAPLWAPRFLASAFCSGPALLILLALLIKRISRFDIGKEAFNKLVTIVTYALLINIFLQVVELFTVLYGNVPDHVSHFRYLFLGLEGKGNLIPWMWTSAILSIASAVLLLTKGVRENTGLLACVCLAVFISIWIDKGLGLVVPGFVPSPLGVVREYGPTLNEILVTVGVWSVGALVATVLYKVILGVREEGLHQPGAEGIDTIR